MGTKASTLAALFLNKRVVLNGAARYHPGCYQQQPLQGETWQSLSAANAKAKLATQQLRAHTVGRQ